MTDTVLAVACYGIAIFAAVGLAWLLTHPDFTPDLVDRPADENTTEGNQS